MITYQPGSYDAVIVAQGYGESALKKTPYWGITCRIRDRRGPGGLPQPCPSHERDVRFHVPDENTAGFLEEGLDLLGLTPDQIDPQSPQYTDLTGRAVVLRCTHSTFNGRPKEEWRLDRPAGPGANSAAATIAARLAARRGAGPSTTPAAPTDQPPPPEA